MGELLKEVMPQDLVKFGLIPEFVGRVPVVVSLDALDKDALVKILTEPKNSLVRQYQTLFHLDGIHLDFEPEALEAIADKSMERKTGARGLRAIMENSMMDLMYKAPSDESITGLYHYKRTGGRHRGSQSWNTENFRQQPEEAKAAAVRKKSHRKSHREIVQEIRRCEHERHHTAFTGNRP